MQQYFTAAEAEDVERMYDAMFHGPGAREPQGILEKMVDLAFDQMMDDSFAPDHAEQPAGAGA